MEVNAKEWMEDIDSKATANALQIALLKQEVRNNHGAVMHNSDVRLAAINDRFDRLEELIAGKTKEYETVRSRMWGAASSIFVATVTAAWFVVAQPIIEEAAVLERRLLDVEKRMPSIATDNDA